MDAAAAAAAAGGDVEMTALGNSADKPIELDLEGMEIEMANMTDLFGDSADTSSTDANAAVDGLFSPSTGGPSAAAEGKAKEISMGILDGLGESGGNGDLFSSFGGKTGTDNRRSPTSTGLSMDDGGEAPFDLLSLSHLSPGFFTQTQEADLNLMDFLNMDGVEPSLDGGKSGS
jgi:hypothetical protein